MSLGKWIEAFSTPLSASGLEWLHPMRLSRYAFATAFNPWMRAIAPVAAAVARDRHAVADDNPLKAREIETLNAIRDLVVEWRHLRDFAYERAFAAIYGSPRQRRATSRQNVPGSAMHPAEGGRR
jgi:hypothetical protein